MSTSSPDQRDDEATVLMMVFGTGLPVLLGVLAAVVDGVRTWLIENSILLVPERSVWVLPGVDAGLDGLRIVILAGAVGLLVVAPALVLRQRRAAER